MKPLDHIGELGIDRVVKEHGRSRSTRRASILCCENRAVVASMPESMPLAARRALLRWYRANGRHDLPWRSGRDPWQTLLAELMLQRTRADLVVPVFSRVVGSMANRPPARCCRSYRRARRPSPSGLPSSPPPSTGSSPRGCDGVPRTHQWADGVAGSRRYAATATLCFAYGRRIAVVDPPVIRILERFSGHRSDRSRRGTTRAPGTRPRR